MARAIFGSDKSILWFRIVKSTLQLSTMPKLLANGVSSQSKSERYHSRGLWALKAKNGGKWPAAKAATVPAPRSTSVVKDTKASGKRTVVRPRAARRFSELPERRRSKSTPKVPTLRPSITPGRVAIVVAGKYQGHRVIVVKALPSGLVVVAGMIQILFLKCSLFVCVDDIFVFMLDWSHSQAQPNSLAFHSVVSPLPT
jgi:hypothetical protein